MLHPGEAPGHGVEIDEALAAKYPYERKYLPVNRLQHDGTLWNGRTTGAGTPVLFPRTTLARP